MKQLIFSLAALSGTMSLNASVVAVEQLRFETTFETLKLPNNENLGLVGLGLSKDIGAFGYGVGKIYGAATGERGGFFVGGIEGGIRWQLPWPVIFQTGVFAGGGGGGAAPQGSGLMIRPSAGLAWIGSGWEVGAELSHVRFPDGKINSTQLALMLRRPLTFVYAPDDDTDNPFEIKNRSNYSLAPSQRSFGPMIRFYDPKAQTTDHQPQQSFALTGIFYRWPQGVLNYAEIAGAGAGKADGYAEVWGGHRWELPLTTHVGAAADLGLGMGGGGRVATGGGALWRSSGGLFWHIDRNFALEGALGYTRAIEGEFKAKSVTVAIDYRYEGVTLSDQPHQMLAISPQPMTLQGLISYYGQANRKNSTQKPISLMGGTINYQITPSLYLFGKATGAVTGGAGGYAEGFLGAGSKLTTLNPLTPFIEIATGVAGGGSVDVGGGLLWQTDAGLEWRIKNGWGIIGKVGYTKAAKAKLATPTFEVGLSYHFSTLRAHLPSRVE